MKIGYVGDNHPPKKVLFTTISLKEANSAVYTMINTRPSKSSASNIDHPELALYPSSHLFLRHFLSPCLCARVRALHKDCAHTHADERTVYYRGG